MDKHTPELKAFWDDSGRAISKSGQKQEYTFLAQPVPVLIDPFLSPEAKQVYALLHTRNYNLKVNGPNISEPLMSFLLGVSLDKIKMAVAELRTARLIHVGKIPARAGFNNEYHILNLTAAYGTIVGHKFLNDMSLPIWATADVAAKKYGDFKTSATLLLNDSINRFTNEKHGVHLSLVERPAD